MPLAKGGPYPVEGAHADLRHEKAAEHSEHREDVEENQVRRALKDLDRELSLHYI